MFNGYKFFPYGYRFIERFPKNSKQVSIILNKIVDLQCTLCHRGSVATRLDFILYILFIFDHFSMFLRVKFVQIFMKENNYICVEYEIPKIPCAIHSYFVKEKQQMLKKSNIPFPYYAILFLLSNVYLSVISAINSKKYPLQNSRYWKLFRRNFWVFYRSPNSLGNYD